MIARTIWLQGGKTDAKCFYGVMKEEIVKFDPERMHTDDGLEYELTEVFGPEFNNASPANTISSSNSSDDDITDENESMTMGSQILFQWERRK